jgi:hypothetical protein
MGQVTIYLDAETEKRMNAMVQSSGLSKSRWISEIIKEKTERSWPDHIKRMVGIWQDLPTSEELRTQLAADSERMPL